MTNLLEHVDESIRKRGLLRAGERIVVAASGGLDSTVLLRVLQALAPRHRWQLAAAHLNHQLRGRSSDGDERFVRNLARRLGLPCFTGRTEVRRVARAHKLSLEMAARRVRHEFLARAARRFHARTITLAHHADDQVELFFLRLLRGAGGEGLQGMKWKSPSPADPAIRLTRPLLDVPRSELETFAARQKLAFRQDVSNASPDILRNRIRHRLLPLLRHEYQPALDRAVLRLMGIVGEESAFVREAAEAWRGRKRRPGFNTLPTAVRRAVVRQQLLERGLVPDFKLVERLMDSADRAVSVGRGVSVRRDETGTLHLTEMQPLRFNTGAQVIELNGRPGACAAGSLHVRWRMERRRGAKPPARMAGREYFDAEKIGPVVTLRHWRPGDRFQPIGLPKSARLQDLLTNARVPAARRRELAVAEAADGRIFWVEDLRIGEAFKLTRATNRRLQWRWRRR